MATETKLKEFAHNILDGKSQRKAIKDTFPKENYSDEYADVKASRLIKNDKVRAILEDNAEKVSSNMVKLALNAEKESDQISAGKDVLDRAGYKPVEKNLNVNLDIETKADENPKMQEFRKNTIEKLRELYEQ